MPRRVWRSPGAAAAAGGQRCSPSITRTAAGPGLHGATAAEPSPSLQPQHRAGGQGASSGAEQRSRPLRHLQQPSKRSEQQEQSHARARPALCIICFNFGLIWGLFGVVSFFPGYRLLFSLLLQQKRFRKFRSNPGAQQPCPCSPAGEPASLILISNHHGSIIARRRKSSKALWYHVLFKLLKINVLCKSICLQLRAWSWPRKSC